MTSTEATPAVESRDKDFRIIVNSRSYSVEADDVSYAQVVDIAYPGHPSNPNIYFEVTYRNAAGTKHDGTLLEGDSVEIKNGTNFHVTQTDRS